MIPLCYARLVGCPMLFKLPEEDKAHTAKHFFCGGGGQKGGASAVWAIFSAHFKSLNLPPLKA